MTTSGKLITSVTSSSENAAMKTKNAATSMVCREYSFSFPFPFSDGSRLVEPHHGHRRFFFFIERTVIALFLVDENPRPEAGAEFRKEPPGIGGSDQFTENVHARIEHVHQVQYVRLRCLGDFR